MHGPPRRSPPGRRLAGRPDTAQLVQCFREQFIEQLQAFHVLDHTHDLELKLVVVGGEMDLRLLANFKIRQLIRANTNLEVVTLTRSSEYIPPTAG